jgi:hypothetical protein
MSDLQVVVFAVLWTALGSLATLVFLLYREVERAYVRGTETRSVALLPGVETPDIDILSDQGESALEFPANDQLGILLFLTTTCTSCVELLEKLSSESSPMVTTIALLSGEGLSRYAGYRSQALRVHWLAHPPDATRDYGVATVPTAYAIRGRRVLTSMSVKTPNDLDRLIKEAYDVEAELTQGGEGVAASSPAQP